MKSKSVSQEVTVTEDTSSENKDKNSQDDLSERLKETDDKKEENKNNTDEKKSEKTSNSSENKSANDKSNNSTNENKKNTSDKNTNSKETLNNDKNNNSENSKSESKNTISYSSYLKDLETEKYTLKEDEKLSDVAKKFKDTCTVNSSLNIIKSLNQISNTSSLESGDTVLVPVNESQSEIVKYLSI